MIKVYTDFLQLHGKARSVWPPPMGATMLKLSSAVSSNLCSDWSNMTTTILGDVILKCTGACQLLQLATRNWNSIPYFVAFLTCFEFISTFQLLTLQVCCLILCVSPDNLQNWEMICLLWCGRWPSMHFSNWILVILLCVSCSAHVLTNAVGGVLTNNQCGPLF